MNRVAIMLFGPTGSGKSGIADEIHRRLAGNCHIINVDALQQYKGLELLSASPSLQSKDKNYHLYNYLPSTEKSNVKTWLEQVKLLLTEIEDTKIVIFCGGTGMYFDCLYNGIYSSLETGTYRDDFANINIDGTSDYNLLERLDKERANKINPNDAYRIRKALDFIQATGLQPSEAERFKIVDITKHFSKILPFYIMPERGLLYNNIATRFHQGMAGGFISEAQNLLHDIKSDNVNEIFDLNISNTLGFKEILLMLKNKLSIEEATNLACQKIRNYAKRQVTWFNHHDYGQIKLHFKSEKQFVETKELIIKKAIEAKRS